MFDGVFADGQVVERVQQRSIVDRIDSDDDGVDECLIIGRGGEIEIEAAIFNRDSDRRRSTEFGDRGQFQRSGCFRGCIDHCWVWNQTSVAADCGDS